MSNTPLLKAIELVGGQVKLAEEIRIWHAANGKQVKVAQAHVWNWLNSNSLMPPAEHCRAIEEITGGAVTRYQLRPDVFGALAECECNQTAAAGAAPLGARQPGRNPYVKEAA